MEVKMENSFSTFKKIGNLAIALIVYIFIVLTTWLLLSIFKASQETVTTTIFLFAVYALFSLVIATIELNKKLSIKLFQGLFYISLGVMLSGLLNLATTLISQKPLTSINSWASMIGGAYLFFLWLLGRGGLEK